MFFRQETCAEIGIHSVCLPLVCSSETIILWNLLLGNEQNVRCFSESFMNLLPTFQKTQTQIKYKGHCTHLSPKCLGVAWGTGLQQGVCGQECLGVVWLSLFGPACLGSPSALWPGPICPGCLCAPGHFSGQSGARPCVGPRTSSGLDVQTSSCTPSLWC